MAQNNPPQSTFSNLNTCRAGTAAQDEAQKYLNQGLQLSRERKFQEAAAAFEESIKSRPNMCAYRTLSYVYRELKRYQEAAANAKKSIEISPSDSMSYNNYGHALVYLK